jgi:subtilisin-like proprotein convertase family protein/subtilisin family serine protease
VESAGVNKPISLRWKVCLLAVVALIVSIPWLADEERAGAKLRAEINEARWEGGQAADEVEDDVISPFSVTKLVADKAAMKAKRQAGEKVGGKGLVPGRQWEIQQGGRSTVLEVALDELWVEAAAGKKGELRALPAQPDLRALVTTAEAMQTTETGRVRLVLYPPDASERTVWNRRLLTDSMLVEWDEKEVTRQQLAAAGVVEVQQPDFAPGLWTARVEGDAAAPLRVLEAIKQMPGVRTVEPLLASQKQKRAVPNDPMFAQQWHLRNLGQRGGRRGVDANVVTVWGNYQGQGISIGVIDDGVDIGHPDLVANAAATGHFDWNGNDTDPSPVVNDDGEDQHGTAVAGVAAARGNNGIGVTGSAPLATLYGLRLIAEPWTDLQEAEAMAHLKQTIQIKNNSWGPPDVAFELGAMGTLMKAALADAATTGRGGKGTLMIWAGGNGRGGGDQSNKDAYANSRFAIAVGSVTNGGVQSGYSESGANLNVSAPSNGGTAGVVTTDLQGNGGYNFAGASGQPADRNYTNSFGGTSSAAPLVSGVAALMLEANPELTVRDVKEIFLRSSVRVAPTSKDWVTQTGGRPDLSPIKHHDGFGGGMVNAAAAVDMAEDWLLLPAATNRFAQSTQGSAIPDGTGQVERSFNFSSGNRLRVETVEVTVTATHTWRGDLEIELISPKGVVSRLLSATGADFSDAGFNQWTFTSVRHWGESSAGIWKLVVRDRVPADSGRLSFASVRIHGVEETTPSLVSHTAGLLVAEGATAAFSATATGTRYAFEWRRNGVAVGGSLTEDFGLAAMKLSDAGHYRVAAMTAVGESQSPNIPVSVVRVENRTVGGLEGRALRLTVAAAGPQPLQYQWKRGGVDLVEGVDATGTTASTLVLNGLNQAMEGEYECTVSDGVRQLSAGVRQVVVTLKPVMVGQTLDNTVVSGQPSYGFAAANLPTQFVARGVPAGMRFDSNTGQLTGRPTRPGTYTIQVFAQNAAGRSEVETYELVVEELPPGTVNTFRGLVERQEALNQRLGGTAQVKVSATGSYSGAMVLAGRRFPFRGLLTTQPGGVAPTAEVVVRRSGLVDLEITFEMAGSGPTVTGTASAGALVEAWSAQPDHWSARARPATAWAGSHTVALSVSGAPIMGTGFAVATISASGAVRLVGRSGNAQPFSQSAVLTEQGEVPMSALIDQRRDSVQGVLRFVPGTAPDFVDGLVSGDLSWVRILQPESNRLYREGFSRELVAEGRRYVRPEAGALLMGLPLPGAVAEGWNAKIGFLSAGLTGAVLESALAAVPFRLETTHRAAFDGAANPAAVRVAFNANTGLVTGSYALVDPNPLGGADIRRRVVFYGILNGGRAQGGFVIPLLPDAADAVPLPVRRTPIVSGSWVILEN